MQFLERIHYNDPMNPLEIELNRTIRFELGIDPSFFEFIFMVDSDTTCEKVSLNQLVSHMVRDTKISGITGETKLANERASWVTMIQVYEYYISQHMTKAFESLFGSVTCLPGCFSLYRIKSIKNNPILIHRKIMQEYTINEVDTLHLKNLLLLGEDRYLTTLLMKHFPSMKTTYKSDAKCFTVAPDTFQVLQSQRRRWINSTIHNLAELLGLDLIGACCFSMRIVVFIDLLATFTQPAAIAYVLYLSYIAIWGSGSGFPLVSILMVAAVFGLQVILFLLKLDIENLGWMIVV